MTEHIRPPKQLNLPRDMYADLDDFVPYPTDDAITVAWRRAAPGSLVPDMQRRGIHVLEQLMPWRFDTPREQFAARDIVARTALGAAQYDVRHPERMFSPLRLGLLVDEQHGERHDISREELIARTQDWLARAAHNADIHAAMRRTHGTTEHDLTIKRRTGRYLGNTALSALVYDMAGRVRHLAQADAQLMARQASLELLRDVNDYGQQLGIRPSVAQLVEPDSPVAVDIRRHAPPAVRRAYSAAAAEVPELPAA